MTRRPRTPGRRRTGTRGRISWFFLLLLLVALSAVWLERRGLLPEPAAVVVHEVEDWLRPTLKDLGLDLPEKDAGPGSADEVGDGGRAAAAQALALLSEVAVETERRTGYDREDWPHWLDVDGDCMDARQEVLRNESLEAVRISPDGCRVETGLWRDAYTGENIRDPTSLDVDHLVPLAEAYRSGGYSWSRERRAAYANDLEDGRSLIAVSASANRSKGDQGPEEWRPPEDAYLCRYVADWVAVKVRWSLSMDERERVTVGNILQACSNG